MASAGEATQWNELSTRYFLEAALRATRNSDLYLVVLDCAARHPGAIARLVPSMDDGAEARARRHADEFLASCGRFVAELARLAAGAADEAPQLRGHDVAQWHAQLTNYMNGNGEAAAPPRAGVTASRKVLQFGRAYFDLVGTLTRIGAEAEEQGLRHVLAQIERLKYPEPMIRLRAAPGETIATELLVQNTRAERAVVSCRVPLLRSVNGVGPAFAPDVVIEPNDFALEPSEEARVHLSLELTTGNFMPDCGYVGDLHVRRGDEPEVRIPLQFDTGSLP